MFLLIWDILSIFCQFQELKGLQATSPYYTSQNSLTWINAAGRCTLWTPSVEFSTLSVNIAKEYITEDLWVGYHLADATFDFLGCWYIGKHKAVLAYNVSSLGRCYAACGSTVYIGISKAGCFCTDTITTKGIQESNCIARCGEQSTPCGRYGYMALYKVHLNDNGIDRLDDEDELPLNISVHKCLERKGQITSSEKLISTRNGTALCWTWNTRRRVIIKYNASSFDPSTFTKLTHTKFGYIYKATDGQVLHSFATNAQRKRALCTGGLSVTVSIITAIISIVVAAIIVAVLTVLLMKKRRTNQGTRLAKVRHVSEHTSYITPISDEAGDRAYTTIQDNGPGGASEEVGIQNPQKIVYESLGERNDEEHSYGTANTQRSAYESLGERHDEEHNYGTPNTHRNAYESLGDRHEEEHGYGAPDTQRLAYESLDERHDEEHSYEESVQATSGFNEPLEEEKMDTHNYEIAVQPRELAYDSLEDKEKEIHCDGTSHQKANVETYEWVE
ncbi:uncharacterized protein LOC123560427 [Mercenaria mercenaria]|uniref:uncharacterized protein LOC123560427 n=1 Tax=Mercenaria mercenaria TaxID=6596 RepID=UPI00234F4706|nr:uncharacterized protein LOC123560427 [Mercenaria mercenaria]